ncbi:MAG: DUF1819 family protein, partial [Bacteroidales bacterium]|nr:DUF1819 family protein [Bacteroidales bacterium]
HLLRDENRDTLLKDEVLNNRYLQVNSQTSRSRFVSELKKRYLAAPANFWDFFDSLSIEGQRAAMLYAILKAYKLVYDFHCNVTIYHWNSVKQTISKKDIMMEFNEIASNDEFVNSWSDSTRGKCASTYLTFLREAGMLNTKGELKPIHLENNEFAYYIRNGEEWFLQSCLLFQYEIDEIKSSIL